MACLLILDASFLVDAFARISLPTATRLKSGTSKGYRSTRLLIENPACFQAIPSACKQLPSTQILYAHV